jgi:hypothetical protein
MKNIKEKELKETEIKEYLNKISKIKKSEKLKNEIDFEYIKLLIKLIELEKKEIINFILNHFIKNVFFEYKNYEIIEEDNFIKISRKLIITNDIYLLIKYFSVVTKEGEFKKQKEIFFKYLEKIEFFKNFNIDWLFYYIGDDDKILFNILIYFIGIFNIFDIFYKGILNELKFRDK